MRYILAVTGGYLIASTYTAPSYIKLCVGVTLVLLGIVLTLKEKA